MQVLEHTVRLSSRHVQQLGLAQVIPHCLDLCNSQGLRVQQRQACIGCVLLACPMSALVCPYQVCCHE